MAGASKLGTDVYGGSIAPIALRGTSRRYAGMRISRDNHQRISNDPEPASFLCEATTIPRNAVEIEITASEFSYARSAAHGRNHAA
jgi:hypothetical protein